ncbi:acyl-CoA dehydrogenase family protein [Rugosimonospora africana]|uniref:Acyl-CoA dehydrogenase n=1 Tax=Rugosimonospora africana TaxID=556532 RepID=A0A8J3QRE0_9ACTN|nr:acyl-CoA dehydrogenase family protein [Rugosimonospora africana]GIH14270.1 acyl-CoA dehydrogenase [Rugosimonospora africana]
MTDQYLSRLEGVIADVVAPTSTMVDREGAFPRKAVDALGAAGILGLTSPVEAGGAGAGMRAAATVVERLSQECGSTAMVVLMHYAAVPVIAAHGPDDVCAAIAGGHHLTTLAFSEAGSRSHFWSPMSTATRSAGGVHLSANKSWVTSAGEADSYVWSSRPLIADAGTTLWLVPSDNPGLAVAGAFDGLGLRGNASRPIRAESAEVPVSAMLGADGAGMDASMQLVLPWFLVLSAAFSLGLMRGTVREAVAHLTGTRLEHLNQTLAEQPLVRYDIGRMQIQLDHTAALIEHTLSGLENGTDDALLRVLEVKAASAEAAITVTDLAMKACGGAAFRRELGIERRFRDARAARVMAPTTDRLVDFVGRAVCGMPLLDPA